MTSLFPDKRDKNYYKIDVEDHLFEVFKHKLRKCKKINIPPTVSITNGKVNNWFFNSKVENGNPILMRNNDKLNTYEILKNFANLKNISDRPTIELLMEGFRKDIFFHKNCAFVRFNNGEKLIATGRDLAVILIERLSSVKSIQGIVDTQSRHGASLNCLVCEYRSDRSDCPPNFSFLIKATTTNAQDVLKENPDAFSGMNINRVNMEYLYKVHQEDIEGDVRGFFQDLYGDETDVHVKIRNEAMKSYINLNCKRTYLKSMDTRSNEEASKIAKELALYIEGSHKIKVKKLVCTFLNDQFHNIYLMGIKELLFDFAYTAGTYDAKGVAESYSKEMNINFSDLIATIHANEHERRAKGSTIQIEQDKKLSEVKKEILGLRQLKEIHKGGADQENIGAKSSRETRGGTRGSEMIQTFVIPEGPKPKQPISNKLMSKLKINSCQGDFCEFYTVTNAQIFVEDFRDVQIESELRKQKEDPDNYKDLMKKPFQILNSLRLKCRENLEETVFLIKKHQIVPRIDNTLIFSDDKDIDAQIMALLQVKAYRKDVENFNNLYKTLHVCKLCYTVYSIMSKHFEKSHSLTDRGSTNFTDKFSYTQTKIDQSTHRSILKDSAINNMSHNELPKIHFKRSSMDEAANDPMGSKRHSRRLTSQRIPTLEKDESGLQLAMKTRGSLTARDTENLGFKKVPAQGKPEKLKNKKSNSTLANTRLLHGILQKVSNPAIEETEKKLMVEREIMKQKMLKREVPTYVHNLLELVTDQDDRITQESLKFMNAEEYEKKAKTASFAFKESLKEIDRETGMRLVRTKDDHFSLSFKSKKQNQINNTDLRRRIVQKVTQHKTQPQTQNMIGKPKYESIFHKNTTTMKAQSEYRLPMARPQTHYKKLLHYTPQSIKFSNYCDIKNMEVPYFAQDLPVEQLIIDAQTAIPFLVLSNSVESNDPANTNGGNVLVVVHDMFDSFFETVQYYEEILETLPNTKIVLFNYPGQAFTAYDSSVLQTNEDVATMLDILMNFLVDSNRISELDKIFLLGIGYGGNIASCFLSYNNNINTTIRSVFLVNSFLRVDQEIDNTAQEWIQVLQTLPADLPEIHINHYYVMALSQEGTHILKDAVFMREKVEKNPIKIEGKIYILKGLLSGLDLTDNFSKLDLNIYVVHSLNNCIFRSNNAELFMKTSVQEKGLKKRLKVEKKGERKVFYYEGGHDISTESPEVLKKMILDFVTTYSAPPQFKAFSLLKSQESL